MIKLDKRACRKYALPEHFPNPDNGLFFTERLTHIVCTAVKLIQGHQVLILYVYPRKNAVVGNLRPIWTVFQRRDDYVTLEQRENGKTTWRESTFDNLSHDYVFTSRCAFYTVKDIQRVIRFCKSKETDGFAALQNLQHQIKTRREKMRQHTRERSIIARMEDLPPIPSSLKRWAHRNVLPAYFFYDYQKRAKSVTGLCTSCGKEVTIGRARHNEKGICPACGRDFTMKSRGRRGYMCDSENYQIVQQTRRGELLIRIFSTLYIYSKCSDVPSISHSESARSFVRCTPDGTVEQEHFYNSYNKGDLTHWKCGHRPSLYLSYYASKDETCCKLYWRNLPHAFAGTAWQYCPLKQFYCAEHIPLQVIPFLTAYLAHPRLEHLVKVGFQNLATDLVYKRINESILDETQNRTHRILRVAAEDVSYLKGINADFALLRDFQNYCERNLKDRQELHRWQMSHGITGIEHNILCLLPYMTAHRLMRYLDRQYEFLQYRLTPRKAVRYGGFTDLLTDYRDYLRMCKKENYDFSNEFILFPKDIQKAHDRISHQIKLKEDAKMRRDFKRACKRILHQLDFERNGMKILYPATPDDIVAEGHALHHCVGNYVDSVAEKRCIILFLRRTEQEDKPFYTVEVRHQKVVQVRGEYNAKATEEVKSFIEQWEKQVLQYRRTPAAA